LPLLKFQPSYSETFRNIKLATTSGISSLTEFFKILLGPLVSEDRVTAILRKIGSSLQVEAA